MGFRLISRIIGIINLIFSSITALGVVIFAVVVGLTGGEAIKAFKAVESSYDERFSEEKVTEAVSGLIIGIAILVCALIVLILFLHILASWKLIKGTEQFVCPKDGLRYCRIWRGITIFFVVIQLLSLLGMFIGQLGVSILLPFLIPPVIYIVKLCLVQQHMNHLERNVNTFSRDEMVHF